MKKIFLLLSVLLGLTNPILASNNTHSAILAASLNQSFFHVDTPALSLTGNFTIELWVKFNTLPVNGTNQVLISKDRDDGQASYKLDLRNINGNLRLRTLLSNDGSNGTVETTDPLTLATGVWYHLAVTYSSTAGDVKFYLDNNLLKDNVNPQVTSIFDSNANFTIGDNTFGHRDGHQPFDGAIDEVRVWSVDRTAGQIAGDFNSELAGNEANLVGYWKFNETAGDAIDSTSNAATLTNTAGVTYTTDVPFSGSASPSPAPPTPSPSLAALSPNAVNTITVIKQVINDNGGTATYLDFPLFINGNQIASGESKILPAGTYTVTETNLPGYTKTFTGNCDANGQIIHGDVNSHDDICTVVNDDVGAPPVIPVPPLISIVKIPSPLALPAGPGPVTYTYTVKNVGTVPMADITLVGDTCSPIVLVSGDTNNNLKLDVNETWIYHCTQILTKTTKNTVVATGHANGLSAVDVASAIVVVGLPVVPPLIHVTKVPNPLALPAGPGMVTYTKKVTNPGTVPLHNVSIADDKCSPVSYISGDTNGDSLLDPSETWTFTCQSNLTQTTVNTAIATGSANGLTVTDFAIATVVVAVPKLPNTGDATTNQTSQSSLYVPLIGITSVPEPLALPKGPGNVTYNYAVKNFLQEIPLTNVAVSDDKCSTIKFVGGDDNGNFKLDYDETWRYTCTVKIIDTTQSVATASGKVNTITATHKAYSTVVVGSDNPPPLISIVNITKVAYPLSLPTEGGDIIYTYKVTNPGVIPLSKVVMSDNKCDAMSRKLGDTNGNDLLDVNEVWIYTCATHLTETTTNTATVTAISNGFQAVGDATITVIVETPALPEAGVVKNFSLLVITNLQTTVWGTMLGILMTLVVYLFIFKNR